MAVAGGGGALNQALPQGLSLGISQANPFVGLSPPSAFLFISTWPLRETSNQGYNEGSTSSLRNVNLCIDEANSHFLSPAYGGLRAGTDGGSGGCVCLCVCVGGHFVESHPLDPGPSA